MLPKERYETSFSEKDSLNCSSYDSRGTNPFTKNDACVNCVVKNTDLVVLQEDGCRVQFTPSIGSTETFWIRVGKDACQGKCDGKCSTDCCPTIGDIRKGQLCFWMYFPPEDSSKQNLCKYNEKTQLPRIYPFYHGGKILGICSSQCPTGNSTTDSKYNEDWTIRLMFREKGRLALLYSVPLGGFSVEPVPPPLQPSSFISKSTDQYWFATKDTSLHPYRLAEYTFNPVSDIKCSLTQLEWPNQIPNPIDQILESGKWNYLMVQWDVDKGTVQVYHKSDESSTPDTIPQYTPIPDLVIDTPENTIPFISKRGAQTFYFQPFFGGSTTDWMPVPMDSSCHPLSDNAPYFIFGNISIMETV